MTHTISRELESKLIEAKQWHDERAGLEEVIRLNGGIAQRNDDDRRDQDLQAAGILAEIVEIVEETWGFARSKS